MVFELALYFEAGLLFLATAVLCVLASRSPRLCHWLGYGGALLASLVGLAGSGLSLWRGTTFDAELFRLAPLTTFSLRIDPLSSLFVFLTCAIGAAISLFSLGYARAYLGRKRVGFLGALFNLLLLSIGLVPLASNVLGFLLVWELMAITSFLLVAFEHEHPEAGGASVFYAIMTQIGTGFLFAAFLLLASHSHGLAFADIRQAAPGLSPTIKTLAFLGALLGFGTKSGVIPMHGWLPVAYPAAPSHVSALMSALMINTGLYGLIRMIFDLLGGGLPWWGVLILTLGALSSVIGALYAVVEPDLKRLLAFSSIENVGIILLGLGSAVTSQALGHRGLAALALAAGLFHMINHSSFKSLLFCGAGAVHQATGTRRLDQLGGLIHRMPQTAALFLLGTAAISALPPLNGFASEWLILQTLLAGVPIAGQLLKLLLPLAASALALTTGLAMVAFVKAFAVGFLAKPRSQAAAEAREVALSMRLGMGLMGALCLALALFSGPVTAYLGRIAAPLVGRVPNPISSPLPIQTTLGTLSVPLWWGVLAVMLPLAMAIPALMGRRQRVRIEKTWGCGLELSARTQYSALGYSQPLRAIFGRLLLPHAQEVQADRTIAPYFKRDVRYVVRFEPIFERYFYAPLMRGILAISKQATRLQAGSIHLYLAYIFATLLIVLMILKRLG